MVQGHPASRCCSSLTYGHYARSSRLANPGAALRQSLLIQRRQATSAGAERNRTLLMGVPDAIAPAFRPRAAA